MNGMKAKKLRRDHAKQFTEEGLPGYGRPGASRGSPERSRVMASFTPGPWSVEGVNSEALHDICLDYEVPLQGCPILIASVYYDHADDREPFIGIREADANARLIAAAPDLLAACKWLLHPDHPIGSDPELIRKAKARASAAIAKATGEAP